MVMQVSDGWLTQDGNRVSQRLSPNVGNAFQEGQPDAIVIHFTAGSSLESAIATMCDPARKVSAHLAIGKSGETVQLVPFDKEAWHAGPSTYRGRSGFNRYSIGIELDNPGRLTRDAGGGFVSWFGKSYPATDVIEAAHRNETAPTFWCKFPAEQVEATMEVCAALIDALHIKTIVGHEEIAPGRKFDPGPAFPLDKLRDRLLAGDRNLADALTSAASLPSQLLALPPQLNIRTLPSATAPMAAPPLPRGTRLKALGQNQGWYQVQVQPATVGWVSRAHCAPPEGPPSRVSAKALNIRAEPSAEAPPVASPLAAGTPFTLLELSPDERWCLVEVAASGWVKREFVAAA